MMNRGTVVAHVYALRESYRRVRAALPWLDMAVHTEDAPAFPQAVEFKTESVQVADAAPRSFPELEALKRNDVRLLRLRPERFPLAALTDTLEAMEAASIPLVIYHTDLDFNAIRGLATERPRLHVIIESGPKKLIYHLKALKETLASCPNVYLCSCNFCNWRGHEELVGLGLGHKLLFGSHRPLYGTDAAMGPIVMGDLSWEQKCGIAGNNLRRLLGMPVVPPPEVRFVPPPPFIIDAHAHNLRPGNDKVYAMPTPDLAFTPCDWLREMSRVACDKLFLTPGETLFDAELTCLDFTETLRRHAPDHFFFFEIFHPNAGPGHLERIRKSLGNPACVGVKIHPVNAKIPGDDDAYAPVHRLAAEFGKAIMAHSWEMSDYNPAQQNAHPDRFRRYLAEFRKTPFVLGHAGGRPSAFKATVQILKDFPNVNVDLSGDYFHCGMIDAFATAVGHERLLFATDVDWFDPACMTALALGSQLSDAALADVFRFNALKVYGLR